MNEKYLKNVVHLLLVLKYKSQIRNQHSHTIKKDHLTGGLYSKP
jgi:hypothetical protein